MRLVKSVSALDYRLQSTFELVRKQLLQEKYASRREQPLGFWALPRDRRLPLAFLGRTVGDLVNTPFHELVATPGVGQKKMQSLVQLLRRATDEQRRSAAENEAASRLRNSEAPPEIVPEDRTTAVGGNENFDPNVISELVWADWRETVRRHRLGREKLGRLAPSLSVLPSVIWDAPLSTYLDRTLADIRRMKTYGDKRVRVVLEVFHSLHRMLAHTATQGGLSCTVLPAFVPPILDWICEQRKTSCPPREDEVRENLVQPLLRQLEVDAGEQVCRLATARLGMDGAPKKVRQLAREMGVTRARVYQLLDECQQVMGVRWPEGLEALEQLNEIMLDRDADPAVVSLVRGVLDLCWPQRT